MCGFLDGFFLCDATGKSESVKGPNATKSKGKKGMPTDAELEQNLDDFEALLGAMQSLRSQNNGMSDEARRAAAEQLIMRVLAVSGEEEGEEGDEIERD